MRLDRGIIYTISMRNMLRTKILGSRERSFLMVIGTKNHKRIIYQSRKPSICWDVQLTENGCYNGGLLGHLPLFSKLYFISSYKRHFQIFCIASPEALVQIKLRKMIREQCGKWTWHRSLDNEDSVERSCHLKPGTDTLLGICTSALFSHISLSLVLEPPGGTVHQQDMAPI